jgi:hypothetical protein
VRRNSSDPTPARFLPFVPCVSADTTISLLADRSGAALLRMVPGGS